ncbi:MAG: Gfo/Idh/MocA family oxidoreductase [Deltaproteobacteria bacterium]|nr:Gfo/Idh/MocA family oxidoreductase [Deltaproteobacteria bacterium]
MIGIGIIGAGGWGERHAAAIKNLDGVTLIAACRTNKSALDDFCKRHHCTGFTEYQDVVNHSQVDAVVIATPNHLHIPVALAAAQAGKPFLLEKPLAPTLTECDEIVEAVDKAGVLGMVGFVNRFTQSYQLAKRQLDDGEVGKPVQGISTMSRFWMTSNRQPWHLDYETGGGVLLNLGIHALDRLNWLLDSPVERVSARLSTDFHDQKADDNGLLFLSYKSGAAGVVTSTGYAQGGPKHLTELICTKGMLNIEYGKGVWLGQDDQWKHLPYALTDDWMQDAMDEEWRQFVHAVTHNEQSPVSLESARHVMAVIFAAMESSRTGKEVKVQ